MMVVTSRRKTSSFVDGVGAARASARTQHQPPIAYGGRVTIVTNTTRADVLAMWKERWNIELSNELESRFVTHPELSRIIGKNRDLVHTGVQRFQHLKDIADFVNGKNR